MTDDVPIREHINLIDGGDANPFFEDTTGHGTSVASVITAQNNEQGVSGINPYAEVYSVKVLDDNNSSDLYTVVSGIYWCINNGINIINMSFGTDCYSEILDKALQDAANAGILMIASAGNNSVGGQNQSAVDYPAALDQVMAVGSSTAEGQVRSASWSSANHSTLINDRLSGTKANIMAIAAANTDSNPVLKDDKKFHGGGNYVLNLKYLYRVADMMRDNPDTGAVTLASILTDCEIDSNILTEHEVNGLENLKNDLETVLRKEEAGDHLVTQCGADTREKKAYMVMGIACHLATDVYAHRVVIETGSINGENLGNIDTNITQSKYEDLQAAINKYRVEFRDLKQYASDKDNRKEIAKKFEDNISVYPTRYSVASRAAIQRLFYCFITNEITFGKGSTVITRVFANSSFSHKINNLQLYAGADNTVSSEIIAKSTDVYRYDPMAMAGENNNDYDRADYHYSDGETTHNNPSLVRYS